MTYEAFVILLKYDIKTGYGNCILRTIINQLIII